MGAEEALILKSEKFNDHEFLMWQEQLKTWLIILGLITIIEKRPPYDVSPFSSRSWSSTRSSDSLHTPKTDKSLEEIKFHYRFRILNCLSDDLYETD